jgi:hypothetical protein
MPFGLTNYLATFMRFMDDILGPFTNSFVEVYLDDILIFIKNCEEHMYHIQQVTIASIRRSKKSLVLISSTLLTQSATTF